MNENNRKEEFFDLFDKFFRRLKDSDKIEIWNSYQEKINGDSYIYSNDEYFFESNFSCTAPWDIALLISYSNWYGNHDYVWYNGYGNLESSDNPDECIEWSEIASYAYENDSFLYNFDDIDSIDELIDFLDYEEDEDEENDDEDDDEEDEDE